MKELQDFKPYVGKLLKVKLQSGMESEFTLYELVELPKNHNLPEGIRKAPFILVFHGPLSAFHQTGALNVNFGKDDSMSIAVYPEREEGDKIVYSAVFN